MQRLFKGNSVEKARAEHVSLLYAHVWQVVGPLLDLAPREVEIVRAIFEDKKEPAIADELGIARSTVHTYFERVFHKLGVTSRVGVVVRILAEYVAANDKD